MSPEKNIEKKSIEITPTKKKSKKGFFNNINLNLCCKAKNNNEFKLGYKEIDPALSYQ